MKITYFVHEKITGSIPGLLVSVVGFACTSCVRMGFLCTLVTQSKHMHVRLINDPKLTVGVSANESRDRLEPPCAPELD